MGKELYDSHEEAAGIYREASSELGWDVAGLCFEGSPEQLNRTEYAQPALYVNSAAAMAVLSRHGFRADVVCGHSLGEYSALAAAGAVSFGQGLRLVAERGNAMSGAAAAKPGSMAAIIGLEDDEVEALCAESGEVWPVNYNSPGQLVVSGGAEAVEAVMNKAEAAGARKTVLLPVTGAFHSPFMRDAADRLKEILAEELQMVSPVRWRQAVEKLVANGVDRFVEVGSGKVLCGLIRRIDREVTATNVSDTASLDKAMAVI
jgi:[acyl-carrier-protein] S-malonyltransferase